VVEEPVQLIALAGELEPAIDPVVEEPVQLIVLAGELELAIDPVVAERELIDRVEEEPARGQLLAQPVAVAPTVSAIKISAAVLVAAAAAPVMVPAAAALAAAAAAPRARAVIGADIVWVAAG
jgi:hypothetical protein